MSVKIKKSPLTLSDRIIIEIRYRDGCSMRDIAKELDRNPSTISREIDGKSRRGKNKYIADIAHKKALKRIENRGNNSKIDKFPELKEYIIEKLELGWSPEQISGKMKEEYPYSKIMRISYEAIYQYIYNQFYRGGNGTLKKDCEDLRGYLPRRRKRRIKKGARKSQKILYKTIKKHPEGVQINIISKQTKLDTSTISSELTIMEIDGIVKNIGNQTYVVKT